MIPIYEQGNSTGIGYSFDSFVARFQDVCRYYLEKKRAHAFAFIFYDFTNKAIREVLKSQGGFARLDRLSGNRLSVFYLHSESRSLNRSFNDTFRYVFNIKELVTLPFVLFLKFDGEINEIEDLRVTELEQDNLLFAFSELYDTIEEYINQIEKDSFKMNSKEKQNNTIAW